MRSLIIITDHQKLPLELKPQGGCFYIPDTNQQLKSIPFTNAKSVLGQEHSFAIYDMRAEQGINFNLDAFAILAGTIQENGTLYLLCPKWQILEQEIDFDALRWNDNHATGCPNFYHHFKKLTAEFGFKVENSQIKPTTSGHFSEKFCNWDLTQDQKKILRDLPSDAADIHLITAPRGRGKSTLAGILATELSRKYNVIITARSPSALSNFYRTDKQEIPFFAPDNLIEQIKQKNISAEQWLFIDEAASLPLPILNQFCHYFTKVVLTGTTHNYEGTGRGFSFKFLPQLNRSYKHWQLDKPLRWSENDPLEQFVNKLLLLNENIPSEKRSKEIDNSDLLNEFYSLLAQAHYKTTPMDLRRLFDGKNQILHPKIIDNKLVGGIWAIQEGGLDHELTQAIWRGKRRPQGSLVAQYLCFQGNLPIACQLRSVRISRIAVTPEKQNQGLGKRLISEFILQISEEKQSLDFISVSFGLTPPLYRFWQSGGFKLVQITPNKEASSGYRSAMMIYPLSKQGEQFCIQAEQAFSRDFALQPFFDEICEHLQNFCKFRPLADLTLNENDWKNLAAFAAGKRSLSSVYVSLKRLNLLDTTLSFNATKAEIKEYRSRLNDYLKSNS